MIEEMLKKQINRMLDDMVPFAVVRFPGEEPLLLNGQSLADFTVVPWLNKDFEQSVADSVAVEDYNRSLDTLIDRLNKKGMGKTVLSRVIGGQFNGVDWAEVADELWEAFPDTLGYLFYLPKLGAWLGATPETLLKVYNDRRFETQALAGTVNKDECWDDKNIEEQRMVVEYIENVLKEQNLEFEKGKTESIDYGDIKHLSTTFRGILPEGYEYRTLLDALAPTPALAGYPKNEALSDICELEKHQRKCYGGYMTVATTKGVFSYVTIRCVNFDAKTGNAAIYVGGGITMNSDAHAEYLETCRKATRILSILNSKNLVPAT